MRLNRTSMAALVIIAALTLAACGKTADPTTGPAKSGDKTTAQSPAPSPAQSPAESAKGSESPADKPKGGGDPKTATSAADLGGLDALYEAAKKEGKLNVIALPHDWANYGAILEAFKKKYPGIQIDEQQPNASSAEEIQAADTNKGTDKAPDVFDLGQAVANENVSKFATYKVAHWDKVPAEFKDKDGKWVNDYTGLMSIGYNATKFGEIKSVKDLLDPKFKGAIALNGNPVEAGAAFNGVVMMALANGGSAADISKGIDFFAELKKAGNFLPLDPTPATVASGQTPVVIDWSYNQTSFTNSLKAEGVEWKAFIPDNAAVGSYYVQAINADAPHPAAARLWMEFLYTPEVQNLWIAGGAKAVLYEVMKADGTLDAEAAKNLPVTDDAPVGLTKEQSDAAKELLKQKWSAAVGG